MTETKTKICKAIRVRITKIIEITETSRGCYESKEIMWMAEIERYGCRTMFNALTKKQLIERLKNEI